MLDAVRMLHGSEPVATKEESVTEVLGCILGDLDNCMGLAKRLSEQIDGPTQEKIIPIGEVGPDLMTRVIEVRSRVFWLQEALDKISRRL